MSDPQNEPPTASESDNFIFGHIFTYQTLTQAFFLMHDLVDLERQHYLFRLGLIKELPQADTSLPIIDSSFSRKPRSLHLARLSYSSYTPECSSLPYSVDAVVNNTL